MAMNGSRSKRADVGIKYLLHLDGNELAEFNLLKRVTFRQSALKRKLYRLAYHRMNKDLENSKNCARYHAKYKSDPTLVARRRESWKQYSKRMGSEWSRLRSKKYRKAYAKLSPSQRSRLREAYRKWAKQNWERRVEYAREYRRRSPLFGFRKAIAEAGRGGNIRELAEICESAIARLDEKGRGQRSKSSDRKGRLPVRSRNS